MVADEFKLAIANGTGWSWSPDAVVAAVPAMWPDAEIFDDDPVPGSSFPVVIHIPDPDRGFPMKVSIHESGRLFSLDYGSPEGSAGFVEWLLSSFPPPDGTEVFLYEWGSNPRVTAGTTARDLLAIGP